MLNYVKVQPQTRVSISSELDRFLELSTHEMFTKHFYNPPTRKTSIRLHSLLSLMEDYNPLEFWSSPQFQFEFPAIFVINLTALASMTSTAFVESIFSIAGRFWTAQKSNLRVETAKSVMIVKTNQFIERRKEKAKQGRLVADYNTDSDDE